VVFVFAGAGAGAGGDSTAEHSRVFHERSESTMPSSRLIVVRLSRLLWGILVAAAAVAHAFTPHHHHGYSVHTSFPLPSALMKTAHGAIPTTSLLNFKNDQEGDTANIDNSSTSIGDVVQNLHGGKYQFSETQYLAGGSVMGQQFAESLHSGAGDENVVMMGTNSEDEELPKWALRLKDLIEQSSKPVLDTLVFDEENVVHTITIKNDEISWEKYCAFVLRNNDDGLGCFRVSPTTGSLAPRGGASNVCDETKPYSDIAKVAIEWVRGGADVVVGENEWLLVVGTEAEVWRYRLTIQ